MTATGLEARRLDGPVFRQFLETNLSRSFPEWPPKTWDFEMLTLAAWYYHPSLEIARAQWAVARGGDKTAAGRPNPTLSATPGYSFSGLGAPSPWLPAISLDVPIETAGKRGYRMAQAAHLSEAARLNITTTAWQVRASLRASLSELTGASEREAVLQRQAALQDEIVRSMEQRLEAGAVPGSEVAVARIARQRSQLDLLEARRAGAEARAKVAEAVGVPLAALDGLELAYERSPTAVTAADLLSPEARRQALLGRADILGALAEYAASQSALQLEIARQYPDLHLGPGYQYDQGAEKVTLALTVELPILNQNQGPIAEAEARRTETAARFNALQARVIAEIDAAGAGYRAAEAQLSVLESVGAAQQKQADAVDAQARAGAADTLDLLNARLELAADELARLDGRLRLREALGALEDAMQRPVATLNPSVIETLPRAQAMKEKQP